MRPTTGDDAVDYPALPRVPESLDLESPLWQFALTFWQDSDIEQTCLSLQSRGWSVTRLLCAAWLAGQGVPPCPEPAAVAHWRHQVTGVIRALRQRLPREQSPAGGLRKALAQAELKAEQLELALAFPLLSVHIERSSQAKTADSELIRAHFYRSAPDSKTLDRDTKSLIEVLIQRVQRDTNQRSETRS